MKKIKFLQVGDFRFDFYDQALYSEFYKNKSFELDKIEICTYFSGYKYKSLKEKINYSIQNRYKIGSVIKRINSDLINRVRENKYEIVFLWRAIHIYPSTIKELKKHAVVIGYNNDQTFSSHHPWWLFYQLKRSIPYYDHYFVYRESDIESIENVGVPASVFMPTFDKERIYPINGVDKPNDVGFIGHYEDDGRDELILKLIQAGFKVRLDGQRWEESKYYSELKAYFGEIKPVYDDYNKALNSSKICLSFLSKLNNDKYTRRTIEIPATKTVMLAEYTLEQASMFKPDIEAVYFKAHQEAIDKLVVLLGDKELRESIALAGYNKVINSSYQMSDRVNDILKVASDKVVK